MNGASNILVDANLIILGIGGDERARELLISGMNAEEIREYLKSKQLRPQK